MAAKKSSTSGGRKTSPGVNLNTRPKNYQAVIKIVGVGGGGTNALIRMVQMKIGGVDFVAANTDAQSLLGSKADIKLDLGRKTTRGLGAGANPETGRQAAIDSEELNIEKSYHKLSDSFHKLNPYIYETYRDDVKLRAFLTHILMILQDLGEHYYHKAIKERDNDKTYNPKKVNKDRVLQ